MIGGTQKHNRKPELPDIGLVFGLFMCTRKCIFVCGLSMIRCCLFVGFPLALQVRAQQKPTPASFPYVCLIGPSRRLLGWGASRSPRRSFLGASRRRMCCRRVPSEASKALWGPVPFDWQLGLPWPPLGGVGQASLTYCTIGARPVSRSPYRR